MGTEKCRLISFTATGWLVTCIQLLLCTIALTQARKLQTTDSNIDRAMQHGPALESYQVSDGSHVDCVRIEEQIAFRHPSLKDHVIKMEPSSMPTHLKDRPQSANNREQLFYQEHGGCPEGTIPVHRKGADQPLHYKKHHPKRDIEAFQLPKSGDGVGAHQYAVAEMAQGTYGGSAAVLSVNDPAIQDKDVEFSLSQLWVVAGSYSDGSLNTAEVGWQVYPAAYGDTAPHLFIYWTADAYKSTGCYNLQCAGFVQTSTKWVLGGAFTDYTTLNSGSSSEYEASLLIFKDVQDGNWWLMIGQEYIGYWPSTIYNSLKNSALWVQWGGEVAPSALASNYTTTAMGSGNFPTAGYPGAAYQKFVQFVDLNMTLWDATLSSTILSNPYCYTVWTQYGNRVDWGTYFFFGGPGGANAACKK